jgi:ribulose-phosphate 3-epimerase
MKIAPSILAADFSKLGEEIRGVESISDRIHVDVMDGDFVPNLSMGPCVVQSIRPITKLPLEVHLMVTRPDKLYKSFIDAGADSIVFHLETVPYEMVVGFIKEIRSHKVKVGIAINPQTSTQYIKPYAKHLDTVVCMTVKPGFAGQKFLDGSLERIKELKQIIKDANEISFGSGSCELEVDGGVNKENQKLCIEAGADVLVMGSALFKGK